MEDIVYGKVPSDDLLEALKLRGVVILCGADNINDFCQQAQQSLYTGRDGGSSSGSIGLPQLLQACVGHTEKYVLEHRLWGPGNSAVPEDIKTKLDKVSKDSNGWEREQTAKIFIRTAHPKYQLMQSQLGTLC